MGNEKFEKLLDDIKNLLEERTNEILAKVKEWKPEYELRIKSTEENGEEGCLFTVIGKRRDILYGFSQLCAELIVECDFEPEEIEKAMQIGIDCLKLKNKE